MLKRTQQEEFELTLAVREVREELRAMREILVELAEATQWQNNNAEDYPALVHDRSALWAFVDTRLPRYFEEISDGPPTPTLQEPTGQRSQGDLF